MSETADQAIAHLQGVGILILLGVICYLIYLKLKAGREKNTGSEPASFDRHYGNFDQPGWSRSPGGEPGNDEDSDDRDPIMVKVTLPDGEIVEGELRDGVVYLGDD